MTEPFIQPSKMIIELDDDQIETLTKYRDSLDHRMINNIDKWNKKELLHFESRQITKKINQYKNK